MAIKIVLVGFEPTMGYNVAVLGNTQQLGCWNPTAAVLASPVEGGFSVTVVTGEEEDSTHFSSVEFKWVEVGEDGVVKWEVFEGGPFLNRVAPTFPNFANEGKVLCHWARLEMEQESITPAVSNCTLGSKTSNDTVQSLSPILVPEDITVEAGANAMEEPVAGGKAKRPARRSRWRGVRKRLRRFFTFGCWR